MLAHLLTKLLSQKTGQLFNYSIVVVDNDHAQSAKQIVLSFKNASINIDYHCEPEQNIALARNRAVHNAKGDFVAFIDDDEFPSNNWLIALYKALHEFKADGVLGPVEPTFEEQPPKWVVKGKFYERPSHKSGFILKWEDTRTGNVLLKRNIYDGDENKFDPKYGKVGVGEDKDFFCRMIEKGYVFVWCNEAPVYEIIPPERFKRHFMLKRALIRGKATLLHPYFGTVDVIKSLIAVPLYTLSLPFLIVLGHHIFMKYLIKDFDHIGKLLAVCGFDIVKQKYIMK